jgi:hypothetical protein
VDHRVKPGDDDFQLRQTVVPHPVSLNRTAVARTRRRIYGHLPKAAPGRYLWRNSGSSARKQRKPG